MLDRRGPVPRPHPTAPVLAAVALVAGILQVMATVMLGLASLEELRAAAAEGARPYLLGAVATTLGLGVVWLLRRRPLIAVLVLLGWQGAVFWPLSSRTSALGLAYHGEYVLHHFTGLVAAAACVAIATSWLRRSDLGSGRFAPAGLALAGTVMLLVAHVAEQPSLGAHAMPWVERLGTAALLTAWASALAVLWRHMGPARLRWVALALLLPFVVRVAFAFPEGLAGASVVDTGRVPLMITMVLAALVTFAAFRPPLQGGVRAMVLVFSGLACLLLYYFYWRGFGELEAGLGGLAQSAFAFSLPYPTYFSGFGILQVWGVVLGLFAMFSAAYSGLVSSSQRVRGVSLALLVVTGLGLSTPPLTLMTSAAALLWLDSILGGGPGHRQWRAPDDPMDAILEGAASELSLPEVVVLEDGGRSLLSLRGEVDDVAIDLRARPSGSRGWEVTMTVGLLGRGRAPLSLVPEPGDDGHRPAHLLGRTHRAAGRVRDLELLEDELLDALLPFPDAHVELWDAGARVKLGADLQGLDDERLTRLVRELVRRD